MASAVADLPEPDSPTSPSVPDSGIERLTSRTAFTSPVWVAKVTLRLSISRRVLIAWVDLHSKRLAVALELIGRGRPCDEDSWFVWHRHSCLCRRILPKQASTGRSAGATLPSSIRAK